MHTMDYGSLNRTPSTEEAELLIGDQIKVTIDRTNKLNTNSKKQSYVLTATVCGIVLTGLILLVNTKSFQSTVNSYSAFNADSSGSSSSASSILSSSITLKKDGYDAIGQYGQSAYLKYTFLNSYDSVIEPHSDMLLHIGSEAYTAEHTYKYTVCSSDNTCQEGIVQSTEYTTVNFDCSPYDKFTISVYELNALGSLVDSADINGVCMYVRRDIESLTEADLDSTMNAMYKLWEVSEEDGQALYGDEFHSAKYFTEAHHFNAGGPISDHIHEGLGFVTQHIKLSNMFEKSMQSVDPSVTLPYWEFTRESTANKTVYDSIMFTESTFGTLREPKDSFWGFTYKNDDLSDGSIKNGRWKKTKTDKNTKYSDIVNGYGLLRSPWNMNPSPYVTRFASSESTLPTCSDYYTLFKSADVTSFLDFVQKGPHAPLHAAVGNTFGCDAMDSLLESGVLASESAQVKLCRMWSFYMKDLYRANYIEPQTDCNNDDFKTAPNDQSCSYVCNADQDDTFIDALKDKMDGKDYFTSSFGSDDDWNTIKEFVCTGDAKKIVVGAHSDSSSPSDPSFWPVHPTQERLLHTFMLASGQGGWKWPTDAQADYVCGTTKCIVEAYGDDKDYYEECCYGHYEYDQLIDYTTGDATAQVGPTNHDTLVSTNPLLSSYDMPYVYDNFEWSHCSSMKGTTLTLDQYISNVYKAAHA